MAIVALVFALIMVGGCDKKELPTDVPSPDIKGESNVSTLSVDSSNCIACHTSETVIAASTFGQDKAPAENTGG